MVDTSHLGMGVMINMLGGNRGEGRDKALGRTIKAITLDKGSNTITIAFVEGGWLVVWDDGQSCCESRYITTDDELKMFEGAKFIGLEEAPAPSAESKYDQHDVAFLRVHTSKGVATFETHNEHNGYYGGFWVRADFKEE